MFYSQTANGGNSLTAGYRIIGKMEGRKVSTRERRRKYESPINSATCFRSPRICPANYSPCSWRPINHRNSKLPTRPTIPVLAAVELFSSCSLARSEWAFCLLYFTGKLRKRIRISAGFPRISPPDFDTSSFFQWKRIRRGTNRSL